MGVVVELGFSVEKVVGGFAGVLLGLLCNIHLWSCI